MMFNKCHYEFIAEQFKGFATAGGGEFTRRRIARRFAKAFEKDNPRFDREKFLVACGVPTLLVEAIEEELP